MSIGFRGFAIEVEDVAGSHDGLNQLVSSAHLEDRAVYLHEQAHAKIFNYSLDGYLHVNLLRLIDHIDDDSTKRQLVKIVTRLFEETALPHERTATFLGVISLSTPDEMATALASLPPDYQDYYAFFDELLGAMPSSFVQYPTAWAIACSAFGSRRLDSLDDLASLLSGDIFAIPGPHERMEQIARGIRAMGIRQFHDFVHGLIDTIIRENGLEPFDFRSDEAWKARAASIEAQQIEKLLIEGLEEFACSLLGARRVTRAKTPTCFEAVAHLIHVRQFDNVFPYVDNKPQMSEEAGYFYAREADANRISRPGPHNIMLIQTQDALIEFYTGILETPCERIRLALVARDKPTVHYVVYIIQETGAAQAYAVPHPVVCMPAQASRLLQMAYFLATNEEYDYPKLSVSLAYELVLDGPKRQGFGWGLDELKHPVPVALPTPDVQPPMDAEFTPYLYVRSAWSVFLLRERGQLRYYNATLKNEDRNEDFDMYVSVIYPEAEGHIPYMSIVSEWDFRAYQAIMDRRAAEGALVVERGKEMPADLSMVVVSLWETLNIV